jgi:hypothetical protein
MAGRRLLALRVPSFHESMTVSKTSAAMSPGSDSGSVDGFKGSRFGTPWGAALTPPPSHCGTAPCRYGTVGSHIGTGGPQIGTGWKMRCSRVIQVVAGGAAGTGIVELRPPGHEAAHF